MHALGLCGWRAGFAALPLCGNMLNSPMFMQEGKAPLQLTLPPPTQYVQEHGGRGLRGEVGGRSRCRFCVSSTGMVRTSTGTVQAQYRYFAITVPVLCNPSTGSARRVPVLCSSTLLAFRLVQYRYCMSRNRYCASSGLGPVGKRPNTGIGI